MLLQIVLASWLAPQSTTAAASAPFSLDELRHVDAAVARGRSWLLEHQSPAGAFAPLAQDAVCPVALTSMALWALASTGPEPVDPMRNAARFLLAHRQPDGGVYDPQHGLSVYTSGVALQALRTLTSGHEFPEAEGVLPGLDLFVYRASAPESLADAESDPRKDPTGPEEAQRLLQDRTRHSPEEQRALEFLARSAAPSNAPPLRVRIPGWSGRRADLSPFSYEDVLPFVYLPLEADQQVALRAYEALRLHYDLERNPDLTKRYGELGFPGTQGLYYYYLLVARALSVRGLPWIDLSSGARRDWVRELSGKLLSLQRAEGAWKNADGHWWEQEPVLVTSYALLALQHCRNVGAR
jgi:hypothetical protein